MSPLFKKLDLGTDELLPDGLETAENHLFTVISAEGTPPGARALYEALGYLPTNLSLFKPIGSAVLDFPSAHR